MNAPTITACLLTRYGWRLPIVLVLAVAVSGATYAVSVSPVGTSMASSARRPPGRPAVQAASSATVTSATDAAGGDAASTQQAPPSQPPGGSGPPGRGGSLTRGLPELGVHAAVMGTVVLVVNGIRYFWQTIQRRRGGVRAPIFHRATADQ